MRKKAPNQKRAYATHFARIERYAFLVDAIYRQATAEALKVVATVNYDPSKPFRFSDYPQTKARIDKIQRELTESVQTIVVNGVTAEWDESNMKNDQLVRSVIGIKAGEAVGTRFERYFNNNSEALHSFVSRKDRGMNLSTKVWNLSKQYKADLELALSIGLSDGRSAAELSRDVRQYLREPARLFRRVMQDDRLRLSRAAKAYHPGAGQYRSSYKNAMRLTRTEINMAYRTADCTRWGQMDFVVGYEVKRSGRAYPCKVCEALAGKYPKSFVWTGWHPQCRCYVIPILKTDDEFWAWDGRGEAPTESVNTVRDLPQGFRNYVAKNDKGIKEAVKRGTAPYWVRDNYRTLI
ncbi:MAG: hypothetical protein RRY42_07545 [Mucinivorans sp.]